MRNIRQVNQQVASELGLDEKTVAECNDALWKLVRKELSNPTHQAIHLKYLGMFHTTPRDLFKLMAHFLLKNKEARLGKFPYTQKLVMEEVRTGISRLWKLKQLRGWRLSPTARKMKTPTVFTPPKDE